LRRLFLWGCFICFDEVTVHHFRNLTSLSFCANLPHPDPQYSLDRVWKALKASGTQLEELNLGSNAVSASLIDYLSSFSGLKKLRLTLMGSAFPKVSAAQFWSGAFPKHTNTLELFTVFAWEEGEWCFLPYNRPLISQCTKLKVLHLSILCRSEQDLFPNHLILDSVVSLSLSTNFKDFYENL
jgi:hypothetical protein